MTTEEPVNRESQGNEEPSFGGKYTLKADFERDLGDFFRNQLQLCGVSPQGCLEARSFCIRFLDATSRMIKPGPREVHLAEEFSCPESLVKGVNLLLTGVREGFDLNPWLSTAPRRVIGTRRDTNDPMLRAWGIHHFHLGEVLEETGYIERTPELLFTYVNETDFYALGIYKHGDWAKQLIFDVLHANWPDVISDLKLRGIPPDSYTEKEIELMRKGNINVVVSAKDSTVYAPIGGGVTSAGTSFLATRNCDILFHTAKAIEDQLRQNPRILVDATKQIGVQLDPNIELRLSIDEEHYVAEEKKSGVRFDLGPLP